jgi:hypothetical protein
MSKSVIVAVGSPDDLRSSIWRLWVQGDEVYFGPRSMLPHLKASLHRTGNWHIKLGKIKVERWRRPKDDRGLVKGIMVLVDPFLPTEPFKDRAIQSISDSDIKWVVLPPYGKLAVLIVALATKDADLDSGMFPVGDRILAKLEKKNGERVLLIAHDMTLSPELSQKIIEEKSKITINVKEGRTIKAQLGLGRAILTFPPGAPGEMPAIYDLCLGWDNVASDFDSR